MKCRVWIGGFSVQWCHSSRFWREPYYHPLLTVPIRMRVCMFERASAKLPLSSAFERLFSHSFFRNEHWIQTVNTQCLTRRKDSIERNPICSKQLTRNSEVIISNSHPKTKWGLRHILIRLILFNFYFPELPADEQLHNLASLSVIDSKTLNPEQLGIDANKEQQAPNLKHSSDQCSILPEDQAQVMLAGVSAQFSIRMRIFLSFKYLHTRMRWCTHLGLFFHFRPCKCCKYQESLSSAVTIWGATL